MRLSHPDYIKLVIGTYKKKRADNELSTLLSLPTPASIRQECINVYQKRYDRKDEPALRAFFGLEEHGQQLLTIIENFGLAKFKPLDQYLKIDGRKGISDKSLELLSWLIDFKHRPFVYGKEVILSEEEKRMISEEDAGQAYIPEPGAVEDEEDEEEGENALVSKQHEGAVSVTSPGAVADVLENKIVKGTSKKVLIFLVVLIFSAAVVYGIWQQRQDNQVLMGSLQTGCMYWTGDRYAEIACADKSDRVKFPMDAEKMKSFQRILREDTITEKSIGKIYYIKINKGIEYYTGGGNHPVEITHSLKPLSRYMYEKYLAKKNTGDSVMVSR